MIEEMRIRGLALIEDATLRFSDGLTVLTGETGAGKTALLGGIRLATGGRADASAVREGCKEAVVEAAFSLDEDSRVQLEEMGFEVEDGTAIVKRRVSRDGRSRCYINDCMASVKGLSGSIGSLVELHGQHEHQALLSPANHVKYLDRWAGDEIEPARETYAEALSEYRRAKGELDRAEELVRASDFQIEQARFVCSQIDPVDPGPSEHDDLEEQLPILRNGESLAMAASGALEAIRGDGNAIDLVAQAQHELEGVAGTDRRLDQISERLGSCMVSLEDIAMELREYRDGVEFDPEALQRVLDRLGELDGLVRRFGPSYEAMLDQWRESKEILETSATGSDRIEQLQADVEAAQGRLETAASELRARRRSAASRFCEELAANVSELAMQGAVFEMREEELPLDSWTATGSCRYELLYAPAGGMTPRPLSKIASGGELSRVMLAIECMTDAGDQRKTLVFDEVDAGVGGSTANAVADRLAELAQKQQVIVVTHLAQIAAHAQTHLLVSKSTDGREARTTIERLDPEQRVAEIARMLSGTIDEASMQHARTMLEDQAR